MWTTFNTGYRLSVSYDAAVVLIDSTRPVAAAAPVLMRGRQDTGPVAAGSPFPQLQLAVPPNRQPAAQPGDVLTLMGSYLSAITAVQVSHPLAEQPLTLTPLSVTASQVTVQLPDPPELPAGIATVAATFDALMDQAAGAGPVTVTSNAVPVALAPKLVSNAPLTAKLAQNGPTTADRELLPRGPATADDRADRRLATGDLGAGTGGEQPAELQPPGLHRGHLPAPPADRLGGQHPGRQPARTGEREPAGADAVRPQPAAGPVMTARAG